MSKALKQDWPVGVKLLSLLVAALLWLTVIAERPGEAHLQVPLQAGHVPAGLRVASSLPAKIEAVVSGPRILLLLLPYRGLACELDLSGATAGTASIVPQQDAFHLPDRELKVLRVLPASIPLTLAPYSVK